MFVRVVNMSDIAKQPNVSLSPKDYIEKKTIKVDPQVAQELQNLLDQPNVDLHKEKLGKFSTIANFTVRFEDGFEVDIKVCTSEDDVFIDPVLVNSSGFNVQALDPCYDLLEEYVFEHDTKQYVVELIADKSPKK